MQEKDMVADTLSCVKASLSNYSKMIAECNNPTLRQTLQKMRDGDEATQYKLYKIAETKGYYTPSSKAENLECANLKSTLSQSLTM